MNGKFRGGKLIWKGILPMKILRWSIDNYIWLQSRVHDLYVKNVLVRVSLRISREALNRVLCVGVKINSKCLDNKVFQQYNLVPRMSIINFHIILRRNIYPNNFDTMIMQKVNTSKWEDWCLVLFPLDPLWEIGECVFMTYGFYVIHLKT